MSDFKIGFRNLVHRFTGACFQASFGPWEERDFPTRRVVGGVLQLWENQIFQKIKQTQMMLCRHLHKSIRWLIWIPWMSTSFHDTASFPKGLGTFKGLSLFFLSGTYPCRSSHPAVPIQNQQAPRSVGVGVRHLRSSRSTGSLCNLVKDGMKVMVSEHDYISGHLGSFRCI